MIFLSKSICKIDQNSTIGALFCVKFNRQCGLITYSTFRHCFKSCNLHYYITSFEKDKSDNNLRSE